jgi:hypothetical protein
MNRSQRAGVPNHDRPAMLDGQLAAVYATRAQRTYSVRSLTSNPLKRARTERKLAPGFLI